MADDIARAVDAIERFNVRYEVTPTDTIIEGESVDEVFAAAKAAHKAVNRHRVITELEIDEQRGRQQRGADRVAAVERRLGRPPRRMRPPSQTPSPQPPAQQSGSHQTPPERTESETPPAEPRGQRPVSRPP